MVNYKVVIGWRSAYPIRSLKEVKEIVLDTSFQRKGVFGHISEREDDGTLGTTWNESINLNFKINVRCGHLQINADTVYCIDGKLIAGYTAAIEYVMKYLGVSKAEATCYIINL